MDWSFRRTKSLGLFHNAGLYHQSSLLDARQLPPRETSPYKISPLGILSGVIVVGLLIYGISFSAPAIASAPVVPVMQTVAPVMQTVAPVMQTVAPAAAPVTSTHIMKHKGVGHSIHRRAPVTSLEPDDTLVEEPVEAVLD